MLIFSLFLLGYCFSLTKISGWRIETTPFFVVSSLIVLLYAFAYFSALLVGAWILSALGLVATLYGAFLLYSERKHIFEKYLMPGFVIPLLFLMLMCSYSFFMLPSVWDEFTHWGPHTILFHYNNGFPSAKDVLIHQDYPPAAELFHYAFIFTGPFVISNVYVAQTILTLAPLFLLFQRFTWSQWPLVFWLMLLVFTVLSIVHADVGPGKTLYMDSCVGIYWGSMVAYFILSDKRLQNIFYLLPIVACFMLLKLGLMPLVLIATGLILTSWYFVGAGLVPARDWQTVIARAATRARPYIARAATRARPYMLFLIPLTAWLTLQSWLHYLQIAQIPLEWSAHPGIKEIIENFFDPQFYQSQQLIFSHFADRSLHNLIMPFILFLAPLVLAVFSDEKTRAEITLIQVFTFFGYFAFLFGLLFLYLYTFTHYEAVRLASYERYVMIYLVGWAMIGLAEFSHSLALKKGNRKKWLSITIVSAIPLFLFIINHYHVKKTQALNSEQGIWSLQKNIAKITGPVIKLTPASASVATIWQNSAGIERAIIVYQLTPRHPNLDCNSYGDQYGLGDVWTCQASKAQFLKNISSMDYLLLAHTDKNFWLHYGNLFPKKKIAVATYSFCSSSVVSPARCSMQNSEAYLYKIIRTGKQIHFQLIPSGAE